MDNKIALAEMEDMIAKLQKENKNLKEELEQKVEFENHAINKHISELSFENKRLKNRLEHGAVSIPVVMSGLPNYEYSKRQEAFIQLPASIIRGAWGDGNQLSDFHKKKVIAYVEKELTERLTVVMKEE